MAHIVRKRTFSKALEPAVHDYSDPLRQSGLTTMSSSPGEISQEFDTSLDLLGSDKENTTPTFVGKNKGHSYFDATRSSSNNPQTLNSAVQVQDPRQMPSWPLSDISIQHNAMGNAPRGKFHCCISNSASSSSMYQFGSASQPSSMFDSSPPELSMAFTSSPPSEDVLGNCNSKPGSFMVFEEPDPSTYGTTVVSTSSDADTYGIQDLSLLDIPKQAAPDPLQYLPKSSLRTSVFAMQTSFFDGYDRILLPTVQSQNLTQV